MYTQLLFGFSYFSFYFLFVYLLVRLKCVCVSMFVVPLLSFVFQLIFAYFRCDCKISVFHSVIWDECIEMIECIAEPGHDTEYNCCCLQAIKKRWYYCLARWLKGNEPNARAHLFLRKRTSSARAQAKLKITLSCPNIPFRCCSNAVFNSVFFFGWKFFCFIKFFFVAFVCWTILWSIPVARHQ